MAACGISRDDEKEERAAATCLVIGDCGTGKSSFINALKTDKKKCVAGEDFEGVTKQITGYAWDLDNQNRRYDTILDVPGLGDDTVNLSKLLGMLDGVMKHGKVTTLILIAACNHPRSTMGHKILMKLLTLGCMSGVKADPSKHIIVVGTKKDVATEKQIKNFMENYGKNTSQKLKTGPLRVVTTYAFKQKDGTFKSDLSDFYKEMRKMPFTVAVAWDKISNAQMAKAVGEVHGWDPKEVTDFKSEFEKVLKIQEKALEAQRKEHEKRMQEAKKEAKKYQGEARELLLRDKERGFWSHLGMALQRGFGF